MRNIWISVTPVSFVGCIPKVLFAFLSSETPPILDTKLPLMYLVFSVHGLLPLFAIQIVQHNCCRAISFLFTVFVQSLSCFFCCCCCCCFNIFPLFVSPNSIPFQVSSLVVVAVPTSFLFSVFVSPGPIPCLFAVTELTLVPNIYTT